MDRLGNYFKENISELQPKLEERLDIELGDVDVRPFKMYLEDVLFSTDKHKKGSLPVRIMDRVGGVVTNIILQIAGYAKAGNSTIYYCRGPEANNLSVREMAHNCLHELSHIAHARIVGKHIKDIKAPWAIREGFCEYTAARIMKDINPNFRYNPEDKYWSCYQKFKKELSNKGISEFKDIKDFLLSLEKLQK